MFGKKWNKHIDDCIDEIKAFKNKYLVKTIITENNDDKGYTAKNNGFTSYHEHMNKHYKIMTYLYTNWQDVYFIKETDEEYIRQIKSYDENAAHDDSPDSAASVIRKLKGRRGLTAYSDLGL
jgi:hypothetical protein